MVERRNDKMLSTGIRFDRNQKAIMWISTKNLSGKETLNIAGKIAGCSGDHQPIFLGCCFGKYDMIAEFSSESAKVISDHVCNVQEIMMQNERGKNRICSSLMLCNEIVDGKLTPFRKDSVIKTYTYLNFKSGINGDILRKILKIKNEIDPSCMRLFWNPSTYWLLLTTEGEILYEDVVPKIRLFRKKIGNVLVETSTFLAIRCREKDVLSDKGAKKTNIIDLTFIKLKNRKENGLDIPDGWDRSWFGKNFLNVYRPGWFDLVLKTEKHTLKEILFELFELKNKNKTISQTSSLILYPEGDGIV
ncbi:MAG: hypothetical protein PVF58_03810 [Candidatus Methanofastidiosia archaeon]|jgi:hypothetical protein